MSRASNSVSSGILELSSNKFLEVGGALWFKALEELTSFRFEGSQGSFTARKERPLKKRSEDTGSGEPEYSESAAYWYGYRKVEGKTRKRYIGLTEDLTLERLEEIAAALDIPVEPRPPKEVTNFDEPYRLLENKLWIAQENCKSLREENEELKAKLLRLESESQTDRKKAIDIWAVLNKLKRKFPKLTIEMVGAIAKEIDANQ